MNTINFSHALGLNTEPFISSRFSLESPNVAVIEETIDAGDTATITLAFSKTNLAFIEILSDLSDCAVTFLGSTGTHAKAKAGEILSWRSGGSYFGANAQASNPIVDASVTGLTIENDGTQAVATTIKARIGFLA